MRVNRSLMLWLVAFADPLGRTQPSKCASARLPRKTPIEMGVNLGAGHMLRTHWTGRSGNSRWRKCMLLWRRRRAGRRRPVIAVRTRTAAAIVAGGRRAATGLASPLLLGCRHKVVIIVIAVLGLAAATAIDGRSATPVRVGILVVVVVVIEQNNMLSFSEGRNDTVAAGVGVGSACAVGAGGVGGAFR